MSKVPVDRPVFHVVGKPVPERQRRAMENALQFWWDNVGRTMHASGTPDDGLDLLLREWLQHLPTELLKTAFTYESWRSGD